MIHQLCNAFDRSQSRDCILVSVHAPLTLPCSFLNITRVLAFTAAPQCLYPISSRKSVLWCLVRAQSVRRFILLHQLSIAWYLAGKSSLILQFLDNKFCENYYPTIEGSFQRSIIYNGNEYNCEIIDTAGHVSCCIVYSLLQCLDLTMTTHRMNSPSSMPPIL